MGAKKLRISQCMIVKNEEENIQQALSWGKELMWEQIVVDTGSTDRTVELAQAMGAKIFHFDWIDDFAAAKNFAIRQASGDWIAFLDADEYMLPEDVKKVPVVLKQAYRLGMDFIETLWLQVGSTWLVEQTASQCRFFRNKPQIRYEQPIHEYLTYNGGNIDGRIFSGLDLSIYHTGYFVEVMEKKQKSERNRRILLKELEKNPQSADIMGYLGDSYKTAKGKDNTGEAEKWYRKALPLIFQSKRKTQRDAYTVLMLMLLIYHQGVGAEQELMELYQTAVLHFPEMYDLDYLVGRFYVSAENYQKGAIYLERAFAGMEKYGTDRFNPLMPADILETLKAMAMCYYKNGDLKRCVNESVALIRADKTQVTGLELLIRSFRDESPEAVVGFLGKLYDLNNVSDRILLLRGALCAGEMGKGVLDVLKSYCTPEELAVLDKSAKS